MSDVYVLGINMMKFGRFPDTTVPELGARAALMALDDAGLSIMAGGEPHDQIKDPACLFTSPPLVHADERAIQSARAESDIALVISYGIDKLRQLSDWC